MAAGIEERLTGVLPVDVHQAFGQRAQRRRRRQPPADVGLALAVPEHVAAQDEKLSRLDRDPFGLQHRKPRGVGGRVHRRLDHRLLRAGAQQVLAAARPQDELQRVDENGLARPRFAREDVQPGHERHRQRVDHRHVLDAQLAQHVGCLSPDGAERET